MKTLYLTDSSANIAVDIETGSVSSVPSEDRYNVRNIYYAEEPMHVVYDSAEYHEEADVKKGEIILLFYNNRTNKYHIDTIRSKRWETNIKNRHAIEQKEKEEWALRNANGPACDCETCCNMCACCDAKTAEPVKAEPVKKTKKSKKA